MENLQWFRCLHKVQQASYCTKTISNANSYKKSDDKKYMGWVNQLNPPN